MNPPIFFQWKKKTLPKVTKLGSVNTSLTPKLLFFLLFQNSSSKSDSMYTDMLVIESKYIRTMLLKC